MSEAAFQHRVEESVRRLQRTSGMPVAFAGTVRGGGLLLGTVVGQQDSPLNGVELETGYGLGGQVAAIRKPLAVDDYVTSTAIRHRYDHIIRNSRLRAMAAAPVIVRRQHVAVLYCAHPNAVRLGSRVLDALAAEARDLEQELCVDPLAWSGPSSSYGELIQDVYAELRAIASRVDDAAVRAEILAACERFSATDEQVHLTPRELDVLALIARSHSNLRIATELGLTEFTVKGYLKPIMQKLGARTRYEAVFNARRRHAIP